MKEKFRELVHEKLMNIVFSEYSSIHEKANQIQDFFKLFDKYSIGYLYVEFHGPMLPIIKDMIIDAIRTSNGNEIKSFEKYENHIAEILFQMQMIKNFDNIIKDLSPKIEKEIEKPKKKKFLFFHK